MKTPLILTLFCLPAALSQAAPYATNLKNNGDATGSFILNESASSVKVILAGGPSTVDLGALAAGSHTFPRGAAVVWHVEVVKDAGPGWRTGVLQQISSDANEMAKFANGRGIAVNRVPSHPAFGRVYVSVSAVNATFVPPMADGIYVRNADFSATALGATALAGSLFATADVSSASPYRLHAGGDGSLYISDWSNENGGLYVTDADCAGGQPVLSGSGGAFPLNAGPVHGSIAGAVTTGTRAGGDLKAWVVDEDLQFDQTNTAQVERNSIWQWQFDEFNPALPFTGPPVKITSAGIGYASQDCDIARTPDGMLIKSQRRSVGNEAGVFLFTEDGTQIAASLADWRTFNGNPAPALTDVFAETQGLEVSPDGKTLAVIRRDNAIHIVPVDPATGFDFANRHLMVTAPATTIGRDLAFDAAYNLYTISSGQLVVRVYAPGGRTKAVTGLDGSFNFAFEDPPPVVEPTVVTGLTLQNNLVMVTFRSPGATPAEFKVQTSLNLTAWENVNGGEISGAGPDFTGTVASSADPLRYYRIKRN